MKYFMLNSVPDSNTEQIEWNRLPNYVIKKIPPNFFKNYIYISEYGGKIEQKTVLILSKIEEELIDDDFSVIPVNEFVTLVYAYDLF